MRGVHEVVATLQVLVPPELLHLVAHEAALRVPEHEARTELTPDGGKPNLKRIHKAIVKDERCPDEEKITEMGQHCSRTERNSESAERDLRRFLVMQLLAEHLGEDFEGTVTGVTNAGVFVQIDKYVTDGFVAAADLPPTGDRWRLNPNTGALVAQQSGRAVTIGHRFVVRLASVDLPARRMELVVVDGIDGDGQRQPVDGRGKSGGKQGGKSKGGKGGSGGKSGGKTGGKPRRSSEGAKKAHGPKSKKKGKAKGKPKGKGKPAGDPGQGAGGSKKKRRKR